MSDAERITDAYQGRVLDGEAQVKLRERINWLVSNAGGKVLDVGCSQGIAAVLCARRGLTAVGVDTNSGYIDFARAEAARKPSEVGELLSFQVGDAGRLDFADDEFDSVLCGELIDRLDEPEAAVAEIARVCKPGGVVAVTVGFGFTPEGDGIANRLLRLLSPHLEVRSVTLDDEHLLVTATPGVTSPQAGLELTASIADQLEAVIISFEDELDRAKQRNTELVRNLGSTTRQLLKTENELDRSEWQRERARMGFFARVRRTFKALEASPRGFFGLRPAVGILLGRETLREQPPLMSSEERREQARELVRTGSLEGLHIDNAADPANAPSVAVPDYEPPDGPVARPDLTVAVILDAFSEMAFRYEWNQVQPTPENWRELFETEKPKLLFVESAWRANGGAWRSVFNGETEAERAPLAELVDYCRENRIPTVFWNKEDPPNFSRFVEYAGLFDHIFTVDGDCIPRYAEVLDREDVQLLPFGAQPRVHNPVSVPGGRVHDVAFAGTYFAVKYPNRRRQMGNLLGPAREFGLHIYSRILQTGGARRFAWPPELAPHVVGSLPYRRMLGAYKAYKVFLSVNSVVDSPTMCARRVFELSACSTPLLSGRSRALDEMFGELVATAESPEEARAHLEKLLGDDEYRDRFGHEAMREVLTKHTYGMRVDHILEVAGLASQPTAQSISVIADAGAGEAEAIERILGQVANQSYDPVRLTLLVDEDGPDAAEIEAAAGRNGLASVNVVRVASGTAPGARLNAGLDGTAGSLVALMDTGADYGEHYLTDLALPFLYTGAVAVGKQAHYRAAGSGEEASLVDGAEHALVDSVLPQTLLTDGETLRRYRFDDSSDNPVEDLFARLRADGLDIYAADRFSFTSLQPAPVA